MPWAWASASSRPAGRDEEDLGVLLGRGRRLLGVALDVADRAVGLDRARHGDTVAAGQLARGEQVDDRQREGEPGRRAADLAGVDRHVEREPGIEVAGLGGDAEEALGRVVGPGRERDRSPHGPTPSTSSTPSTAVAPGCEGPDGLAELARSA